MKILITGGCGFVGSNIAVFLKKKIKSVKIESLDNLTRKGSRLNRDRLNKFQIHNYNFDIKNYTKFKRLKRYDFIIDCCAEPAIESSFKDPDAVLYTNLIGTFNVVKKCLKDNSCLIFLSSSRVYSIKNLRKLVNKKKINTPLKIKKKIRENFETSLESSLYGFTKLASEKLIKEMFFTSKNKYLINRFGVIAGPWQFGKQDQGFVSLWVAKHMLKKKLSYIGFGGKGHQVRDIIHIDDVCEIILCQLKKINKIYNDTFNIGGGPKNSLSLKDLTLKCQRITKNKIKISKKLKTSILDIPYYVTDNRKIFNTYKWKPFKSVDQTIKDIYFWLNNLKDIRKYFK